MKLFYILFFFFLFDFIKADITLVRDAESEEILKEMAQQIFKVAKLRTESAKVYIINSEEINAFTIGNGYIFITSGLLLFFDDPLQIVGILCHETGHIAAGHINRKISAIQNRSVNTTLAMLAGIIGASITGSEKAMALALGYVMTDERLFLRFSRGEELAADALAVEYLEKLGYGADVLIDVFGTFNRMDHLTGGKNLPAYISSHPKPEERIFAVQKHAKHRKYYADQDLLLRYKRIRLKIKAYLNKIDLKTVVPEDDYSKAIYFYRIGRTTDAINLLQHDNSRDIYQKETLAQILYDSGQLKEAINIYEGIYSKNIHALIKINYSNVLIEANTKVDIAISILESLKYSERFNSEVYRLLAKGYGKLGKKELSMFMLAQEQMLLGNYHVAYKLINTCIEKLDKKNQKKAKYLKELLERDYREYIFRKF
ncbi:MAG: M48 family metalloprotease [Holosporaceae bacterium]|jgi:predicted Zn-dependent protease|nr:M48 family metalloprotease [Holosporaceae bacterium]